MALPVVPGCGVSIFYWKLDLQLWMFWFKRKIARLLLPEDYSEITCPKNIQQDQYFHRKKRSERSGAIKPTLCTTQGKNRLKTALGQNDDKMIVLVQPPKRARMKLIYLSASEWYYCLWQVTTTRLIALFIGSRDGLKLVHYFISWERSGFAPDIPQ